MGYYATKEAHYRGKHSTSNFGKLICDFLLVITANIPPILHHFQVMADYWSNFR